VLGGLGDDKEDVSYMALMDDFVGEDIVVAVS
jgi:hypothetical protein